MFNDLLTRTGQATDKYVNYIAKRIKLLQFHKMLPIMVFDGCSAPSKRQTQTKRRETREVGVEIIQI